MKIKYIVLCSVMLLTYGVCAHEGDEEVTVKNAPRFGGRVSKVILDEDHNVMGKPLPSQKEKHAHKGEGHEKDEHGHTEHNDAKFMSEILVSDENKVRLYFYDLSMKDVDLSNFPEYIYLDVKFKGMNSRGPRVKLKKTDKNYIGELPVIKKKPYSIFVDFNAKNMSLHITFNSMD